MNNQDAYPVPKETVEAGLLFNCSSTEQWLQVTSFSVDEFEACREIYLFYQSHLANYGSLPTADQVRSRFTWQPPIGEFKYWLKEMKRYSLTRKIQAAVMKGWDKIENPDLALSTILEELSFVRTENNHHIQATDNSALERLQLFDNRTQAIFQNRQILGLRTGTRIIDETLIGWIPASLVGVIARPGVGKTWWLMWQGAMTWQDGGTVLAICPEMPANMLSLRIDILIAALIGHELEYGKVLTGDPNIRNEYQQVLEIMSQSKRWWTYDTTEEHMSVGDIASLIRQHEPDQVLIDGVSLLRSRGRNQASWEQMREICYDLKNLATIHEIPILVTHQAVNSARGRRTESGLAGRGDDFIMPSLNDAAYGDAFAQACSDVITMVGEPESQNILWFSIRKHRERGWTQPLPARMALAIDFAKGKIIDLSVLGHDKTAVGQEARRQLAIP